MFEVQDKTGLVVKANAYLSVADFRQYFTDAGTDLASYLDDAVQGAIVQATRFIDTMFEFYGSKIAGDVQTTEFPRYRVTLPDPPEADVPQGVKDAVCEYGIYVLSGKSLMIALAPEDAGIAEKYEAVDEIRERTKYIAGNASNGGMAFIPYAEALLLKTGWLYVRKNAITRT
jgi:hypothetical protein